MSESCQVNAAVGLDQHLGHLGPRELLGRHLARLEQLAHLRPGQEDVLVAVRAGTSSRVAIDPQARQKNECSKNIGSMSSSCGSNSSKISCAS